MLKYLKGKVSIHHRMSNFDDPFPIEIELEDELSGAHFLYIQMSLEDFAKAITGQSCVPCEFNCVPTLVGKRHEHKEAWIPAPGLFLRGEEWKKAYLEAVKPLEVDGWQADFQASYNGHWDDRKTGKYKVILRRYVDAD